MASRALPAADRGPGAESPRGALGTPARDPESCAVNRRAVGLRVVFGNGGLHDVPGAEDPGGVVHPAVDYGVVAVDQEAGDSAGRLPIATSGLDHGHDEGPGSAGPVALTGSHEVDTHLAIIETGAGHEITTREIEAGINSYGRIRWRRDLATRAHLWAWLGAGGRNT